MKTQLEGVQSLLALANKPAVHSRVAKTPFLDLKSLFPVKGENLTPDQRAELENLAKTLYKLRVHGESREDSTVIDLSLHAMDLLSHVVELPDFNESGSYSCSPEPTRNKL